MSKKNKNKSKESHHDQQQHQPSKSSPSPDCKKRKRSLPSEDGEKNNNGTTIEIVSIVPHVIQWLEKRKKKVPHELQSDGGALSFTDDIDRVVCLLPSLRERERRALVRHVEKCINNKGSHGKKVELEGSDGEYDIHNEGGQNNGADIQSSSWPATVQFGNDYRWNPTIPKEIKDKYSPPTTRQRAPRLSNKVYFKRITDPDHPAHGEFGLYCAVPHAPPGSWLLDYVGHVTLGEDQDKESDYVSDFGEKSELACDANNYGNEARFLNDFRNTGKHPNVEFNTRRDKNGELRQGVFVKLKKDAKGEGFDGVKQDEELLVSYGKSYWRSRVGNLTDFVWRLPGKPMTAGGKPTMENGHEGQTD
mmetsp:Transcript_10704/g.23701  ORF Transcript_10704/g.23701 Transcript_10704/m.23701 type:complete len:362 (+) Transcript_10704:122-1207(+)|eukprot:CAMPEP_0172321420 /NCGR_PEP_ID=MMETSP1058-20130122/43337_1 /TAXON_ID=83371 /ORGANISM="Detonula confervacea, Strain CCMP 353" /LENGTH=361 /DNA_ID=CAMNT_0013036925 /DNA_START=21 /DNA_END=1106 /DNA_ORIENTATION=+